jgi:putative peptide modification system cyclase
MLRTVVLADLADSTQFIQRLGDAPAATLLQRLDLQIRDLLVFTNGRLIDKADGLLALFERPVQAVDFALRYQHALRDLSAEVDMELKARIGIHVGDVMTWVNTPQAVAAGAKPLEVEGLAKPVAARLMTLAMPGQILLSGMAQTLAHRAQSELGERASKLRWLVHGRYRFKGVPAPMIVHEVGEAGFSPLRQPPSGQKSWREVPLWRRPPVLAVELICVVGVLGGTLYTTLRSPPALAFGERDWVVVGDMNNFTGDDRLKESLDTALRVSLEQSRYVNLVSELKVQDTLKRMGRDDQTTVDRAIGSEIALREGARALLLPSVAEVGGRLRVNIEVVDPNNQVTVFAESAEGAGAESALASIDDVNGQLREKLGESMTDIKADGKPLAEVTTGNLDALRAYSLARDTYFAGKFKEAIALYQQALTADPDFAMAHIGLGRLYQSSHQSEKARAQYAQAQRHRQRITRREALLLDAYVASMGKPVESQEKWKLLTAIYPDAFEGYYAYALTGWASVHNYAESIAFLQPATSQKHIGRGSAYYLTGVLRLTSNDYPGAIASFKQSEQFNIHGYIRQYAEAHAAQRNYKLAAAVVQRQTGAGVDGVDLQSRLDEILFPIDQGQLKQGLQVAAQHLAAAQKASSLDGQAYRGIELSLRSYQPDPAFRADLQAYVREATANLSDSAYAEPQFAQFSVLYGGWLATRAGDLATGRSASAQGASARQSGYPVLASMAVMLDAERALAQNKPEQAIALLRGAADGRELYLSHSVLMRAYAAAGKQADAVREAGWLAENRGRAYGEWSAAELPKPVNVMESTLALLYSAEYAMNMNQPKLARQQLQSFLTAWPGAASQGWLHERVQKLRIKLERA